MSILSKVMQKVNKEFHEAKVTSYGYTFETGVPVSFSYLHREGASSGYSGDRKRFQQDIEPAGKYVIFDEIKDGEKIPEGYKAGKATLKNPLVLQCGDRYDATSWKQNLFDVYKKTGRDLTQKLIKDGFDGVITVDGNSLSEIVLLLPTKEKA